MSKSLEAEKRPRRVSRQREAGEVTRRETRRKLLIAAAEVFAEEGYVAATVSKIADRADVSVQSLYHAWGNKRGLLRGVMEAALFGDLEEPPELTELAPMFLSAISDVDLDDPEALIAAWSHQYRLLAERASSAWRTHRDASAVDPDIAADWQQLQEVRHRSLSSIAALIPARRRRLGLTKKAAGDTFWCIASPESYELLVDRAGYSLDQYEEWVRTTLCAALLRPHD